MEQVSKPEVWQRGPIPGISALLQPVAHALLQAEEEITEAVKDLPAQLLWQQPKGVASIAFHIQHITGVLDRLFTYAKGEILSERQLHYLKKEGVRDEAITGELLLTRLNTQVEKAINQLKETEEGNLSEQRGIGRKQIPTTVIGLLFHAAEHSMRHTGQLLVTVKILSTDTASK